MATGGGQFSRMFIAIYAAESLSRNAGSFLRKELGEALRNTENKQRPDAVPPSPDGATRWPGFKVFALCAGYAHILARLRSPLQDFCLWKGAFALRHAALEA